ncbi:MAG TPA: biopolymer transporter ExbD [Pyrinomonadaceae bacterium]|nr:biopolymer transporter ExbD [Pyrinomonadaceae bacterium]
MKPTSFRLIILALAIVLGVAISTFLSNHNVSDQLIPPIDNSPAIERISYPPVKSVVISVPADGEFYIGKQRFDLSQISDVVTRSLISIPSNERTVYLKSAIGVKAETLAFVIKEVKRAGVDRIELVLDKKKTDPMQQSPVPPNKRLERTRR